MSIQTEAQTSRKAGRRIIVALLLISGAAAILFSTRGGEANVPISTTVDQLVDAATRDSVAQAAAFKKLEALGEAAVPSIVSHLYDMRKLPNPEINFDNRDPNGFEGRTYYGAEVMHDALSALLRDMTGQAIGAFDADRPAAERQALRQRERGLWLQWCRARFSDRASECGNG